MDSLLSGQFLGDAGAWCCTFLDGFSTSEFLGGVLATIALLLLLPVSEPPVGQDAIYGGWS